MERRNLTYEENKKANLLCVVSLVLMFAPLLLYCAGLEIADTYLNIDFTGSFAHLCICMSQLFVGGCAIASLVVMIYVRVKYPQNTFGKVIMWLYIVEAFGSCCVREFLNEIFATFFLLTFQPSFFCQPSSTSL